MREYYLGKLTDYKYLTLRHRGYPFVMYGKKNPVKAQAGPVKDVPAPVAAKTSAFEGEEQSPVTYSIDYQPKDDIHGPSINVTLDIAKGWHAYVEQKDTTKQEFIPVKVSEELPKGFFNNGPIEKPFTEGDIYLGKIVFKQYFAAFSEEAKSYLDKKQIPVKVHISYQVCNDQMCLPPAEHTIEKIINL